EELRSRLQTLAEQLDRALARQYGVDPDAPLMFSRWCESHQPFHWFAEFYGVMSDGGFDVIIGNPPYVEYSKVRDDYSVVKLRTEKCGNLYAMVMERSVSLISESGWCGLIVLIGSMCTKRMALLQEVYRKYSSLLFVSSCSGHTCPGVLFEGVA